MKSPKHFQKPKPKPNPLNHLARSCVSFRKNIFCTTIASWCGSHRCPSAAAATEGDRNGIAVCQTVGAIAIGAAVAGNDAVAAITNSAPATTSRQSTRLLGITRTGISRYTSSSDPEPSLEDERPSVNGRIAIGPSGSGGGIGARTGEQQSRAGPSSWSVDLSPSRRLGVCFLYQCLYSSLTILAHSFDDAHPSVRLSFFNPVFSPRNLSECSYCCW